MGALERGRASYHAESWAAAYEALSAADRSGPLAAPDLELLANAAYMIGRDADYLSTLERAYRAYLDPRETPAAVRCAFWIGFCLARTRGEPGRASGWLGRARRLLDEHERDCVERGYLPVVQWRRGGGHEATAIAQRFGDADLFALAVRDQGHALIADGEFEQGLRLLDEAMVAVTAGELSPIVAGIVYCGVILSCQDAQEVSRAREWTVALTRWCERQPDLVAFTGRCLVDRAGVMQMRGTWAEALAEARRAGERCVRADNAAGARDACYRQGEIHRLRGELAAAEEAYREASRHGWEPQPGLALLRLAQGRAGAAAAAIRRITTETAEPAASGRACCPRASRSCWRSASRARRGPRVRNSSRSPRAATAARSRRWRPTRAASSTSRRAIARAALASLRRAGALWAELEAPYEVSAGQGAGRASRAGRSATRTRPPSSSRRRAPPTSGSGRRRTWRASTRRSGPPAGSPARELEVLRHLAAGETNRAIAAELVLSERTIDRHVSNIFAKLGVSSRAAATALRLRAPAALSLDSG